MTENRKLILDKFQEHLDMEYHLYCQRHHIEPSTQALITFLIDHNLIPPVSVKRYTVIQEFEELIKKMEHQKTKTVNVLSDKFNIPERTIWGILKKRSGS